MPSSKPAAQLSEPDRLRPYIFHGVHLAPQGSHAVGDCPFCGKEGKFSLHLADGLWRCWVCGSGTVAGGGNGLVFIRLIHEHAAAAILAQRNGKPHVFHQSVAADRRLLSPDTVAAWGVVPAWDGTWLVPGYGTDGVLDQVYRRIKALKKGKWIWELRPTPGIWTEGKVHALHLTVKDFDPSRPNMIVCEGPWDGMALWEVGRRDDTNIVAIPGCNVWRDEWTKMCEGKHVTIMFDSDHPLTVGSKSLRAGYDGVVRVAKRLSGSAASVRWLRWGPDGFDPERPSGWDVRDHLTSDQAPLEVRRSYLADLMNKLEDAPREWFNPSTPMVNGHARHGGSTESLPCETWVSCEAAWREALEWRQDLGDALAVMLAVCASTQQAGNQLFLDLIGSPGSAKTTLAKGLLVSGHCIHLENATKLISGYKKPGDEGADCSFLARANGKTWVTCEFDVLASSPQYRDLMGKVRRIFDGETSATYGNSDVDKVYAALRTPWIRAGTHKMVDHDQSQLGDRFLRFYLNDPSDVDKRLITMRALRLERSALVETANASSGSVTDPQTRMAHSLTGGYVDWLRANAEAKLGELEVSEEAEMYCADLAELSADLRARPTWEDARKSPTEAADGKELPTRLARQNIRLASCLAVVLNKRSVDQDVLRIVKKVALDTASGHSLNIVQWLCSPDPRSDYHLYQEDGGLGEGQLRSWTGMPPERLTKYLLFLKKIGVVEWRGEGQSKGAWFLTDRVYTTYLRIVGGLGGQ